jgi:hypothetical protein
MAHEMGSGLAGWYPPSPENLWGQEGAEFADLTDAQKREFFRRLDSSNVPLNRELLARELQGWSDMPDEAITVRPSEMPIEREGSLGFLGSEGYTLPEFEPTPPVSNWRQELLGQTGATAGAAGGAMPYVDKDAWERIDYGAQDSRLKELLGQTGAPAGALGGAYSNMAGMLNPPSETISEMMIEERGAMPDEFGNMTPVPSSDEEAVKQDFRRVLADGTIGDLRQYIEMNIGDLRFLAQTDNSIAKDLEAALRFISTGDQSRFQGPSPDQNLRTWGDVLGEDQNIAQKTFESPPLMEGSFQAAREGRFDPPAYLEMYDRAPYGEATPDMRPREPGQPYQTAPGYDTLLEPYQTVPRFAHGGYVRGRGRGRGTMPGELQRKGSLPVRVAGESMGEYKKHREDEDDVRPVRRTLDNALSPTLSRRMFS